MLCVLISQPAYLNCWNFYTNDIIYLNIYISMASKLLYLISCKNKNGLVYILTIEKLGIQKKKSSALSKCRFPSQKAAMLTFLTISHDDIIKWKHFLRYWPFMQGIHRSLVNSPQKGQWWGALMFSLICIWINGWVDNGEVGDLRCYHAHYDITVMQGSICGQVGAQWVYPCPSNFTSTEAIIWLSTSQWTWSYIKGYE